VCFPVPPGYSQKVLGTCLCNSSDFVNFEPDGSCIPSKSCQDTHEDDLTEPFFWGCQITMTSHPSSIISGLLIQQACINNALDNGIYCRPANEKERDSNIIVTVSTFDVVLRSVKTAMKCVWGAFIRREGEN